MVQERIGWRLEVDPSTQHCRWRLLSVAILYHLFAVAATPKIERCEWKFDEIFLIRLYLKFCRIVHDSSAIFVMILMRVVSII